MKIVVQAGGQTDEQTDGIDLGMYSERPFEWYMTRISKLKSVDDEEINIPPPLHWGGGGGIANVVDCALLLWLG